MGISCVNLIQVEREIICEDVFDDYQVNAVSRSRRYELIHGKNSFAERSKTLTGHKNWIQKVILSNYFKPVTRISKFFCIARF